MHQNSLLKFALFFTVFQFLSLDSTAQKSKSKFKNFFHNLITDSSEAGSPRFLIYPTVGYSPETRIEVGIGSIYVYNAKRDTTNRLSELYGFTFYTQEKQHGIWLDNELYTHQNKWSIQGRFRYMNFPLFYHGIGANSPEMNIAMVDATQFQLKERFLKKIKGNLFFGPEIDYQRLSNVHFITPSGVTIDKPVGAEGSSNLGIGAGILFDQRHNPLNVREGIFAELAFLHYDNAFGSNYTFSSLISDNRFYKSINKRDVLAIHAFAQFNRGNTPFNQLALLGGERLMRGYYLGRLRDNSQMAAQVEYRMLPLPLGFTKRIGAVVFGGAGSVFENVKTINTKDFVWSAGAGLRFLIFPKKDIYTRFDYAITKEGSGIYFFIGEAF